MMEGDVLVEKKLGPKGTPPGLVANIPRGCAFAIEVSEQSGVSGFVLPVTASTSSAHDANDRDFRAETILQNVLVLAAGQVFTPSRRASVPAANGNAGAQAVGGRCPGRVARARRFAARRSAESTIMMSWRSTLEASDRSRTRKAVEARGRKTADARRRTAATERRHGPENPAESPAKHPQKPPRIATIYRGAQKSERIRTDLAATAELDPLESRAFPDATTQETQVAVDLTEGRPANRPDQAVTDIHRPFRRAQSDRNGR